ncbi:MAG: acyltransferase [Corynebacteriales bacterium]|nr:acyltransferase [Mycobacteriales bacterium]
MMDMLQNNTTRPGRRWSLGHIADPPRQDQGARIYALDALRLMAALAVVAYHFLAFSRGLKFGAWQQSPAELFPNVNPAASYGWLGVQLFFLISGFVICMSCWGKAPSQFLISRIIRLYPGYWAAVLITSAVLLAWPIMRFGPEPETIYANLTMFQAPLEYENIDGVYWSLWIELKFYMLFGVLVAIGLNYVRIVGFCLGWMALVLLAAQFPEHEHLQFFAMREHAPLFVGGIAMYLMYRFGPDAVSIGLVFLSWLMAQRELPELVHGAETSVRHELKVSTALIIVTACYALVLATALGAFNWARWRGLTIVGALTYPLYLLHQNIGWTIIRLNHDKIAPWLLLAMVVTALLVASWLLHIIVERPVSAHLKRLLTVLTRERRPAPKPIISRPKPSPVPAQRVAEPVAEQRVPVSV